MNQYLRLDLEVYKDRIFECFKRGLTPLEGATELHACGLGFDVDIDLKPKPDLFEGLKQFVIEVLVGLKSDALPRCASASGKELRRWWRERSELTADRTLRSYGS